MNVNTFAWESTKRDGFAESALPERALAMLYDPVRSRRLAIHRRLVAISIVIGVILLAASVGVFKADLLHSIHAQRFLALLAVLGAMLLFTGILLTWHSSITERHLHRLAMLRLNLDSQEATAEAMRMRMRIAMAKEECERLPESRRGQLAVEVLTALTILEENAQGSLSASKEVAGRLIAAGMREKILERFTKGEDPKPESSSVDKDHYRRMPA